ncbi:MAG TPA: HD domain-containing protein, partial [Acidimicrobiales bacterium]|nr:HD domain-containing protein [Acidimicrobiales bacterium]
MTTVEKPARGRAAATVERVLPWRRQGAGEVDLLAPVLAAYRERHPKGDASLVIKAYEVASRAHDGQVRRSGEAFITHPLAVSAVLAGLGMDDITLAAALLHDSVEDTAVSLDEIESRFGPAVAQIVDGVTKLERVSFDSRAAAQAATMRKMLVAMAK